MGQAILPAAANSASSANEGALTKSGYARTSTDDQTTVLQFAAPKRARCSSIFEDKGLSETPVLSHCRLRTDLIASYGLHNDASKLFVTPEVIAAFFPVAGSNRMSCRTQTWRSRRAPGNGAVYSGVA